MALLKGYGLIDAMWDRDFSYIWYCIIKDLYLDYVKWPLYDAFTYHVLRRRCENCRNWKYAIRLAGIDYGTCEMIMGYWWEYNNLCMHGLWNLDPVEDAEGRTRCEDGWQRTYRTSSGKIITQISRGGVWQYLHDGDCRVEEEEGK